MLPASQLLGLSMTNLLDVLAQLRRPRLLMRAARFGLAEYRRTPALRARLAAAGAQSQEGIVAALIQGEAELEARRLAGDAGYSVARHVEVLIALMAEARLLEAETRPSEDQPKASGMAALRRAM